MRRTSSRRYLAGLAASALVAGTLATAGLVVTTAGPAVAATNGSTTYEADCMGTGLGAGQTAPFIIGLNITASPDGIVVPPGGTFGATGAASVTLIGPVIAGANAVIFSPTIGATVTAKVGSTDGTATGTFTYTHTFTALANPGRQSTALSVSWATASTTLTGAAGTFLASDVGKFVAHTGIDPNSTIVSVTALGDSATISTPTTAAGAAQTIGIGANLTFTDPAFSTGNVFTTNVAAGGNANIGIVEVDGTSLNITFVGTPLVVPFGGTPGVGFILTPPATTPHCHGVPVDRHRRPRAVRPDGTLAARGYHDGSGRHERRVHLPARCDGQSGSGMHHAAARGARDHGRGCDAGVDYDHHRA